MQTGRGSREDFLASVSRDAPELREVRGVTDEEALAGVVVTREVEFQVTRPEATSEA